MTTTNEPEIVFDSADMAQVTLGMDFARIRSSATDILEDGSHLRREVWMVSNGSADPDVGQMRYEAERLRRNVDRLNEALQNIEGYLECWVTT